MREEQPDIILGGEESLLEIKGSSNSLLQIYADSFDDAEIRREDMLKTMEKNDVTLRHMLTELEETLEIRQVESEYFNEGAAVAFKLLTLQAVSNNTPLPKIDPIRMSQFLTYLEEKLEEDQEEIYEDSLDDTEDYLDMVEDHLQDVNPGFLQSITVYIEEDAREFDSDEIHAFFLGAGSLYDMLYHQFVPFNSESSIEYSLYEDKYINITPAMLKEILERAEVGSRPE